MKMDLPPERYRALPVQVIEAGDVLVLKRGVTEVKIGGAGALEVVRALLAAASGEPVTLDALLAGFAEGERPSAAALLQHLLRRRLLVPAGAEAGDAPAGRERPEEVFYWQFGQREEQVLARLDEQRIVVVGVNTIARQLLAGLLATGARSIACVDDPALRNIHLFDETGVPRPGLWPADAPVRALAGGPHDLDPESFDCLVVTADFGGLGLLRAWNEYCVLHRRLFLPVALQDAIGYVGPLVVPGETACFECFRQRVATHVPDPHVRLAIEAAAAGGRGPAGFVPPMTALLGDLAAMELLKFFGLGPPLWQVGTVIEVNLMLPDVTARRVLKLPRCPICTPVAERPSLSIARAGGRG